MTAERSTLKETVWTQMQKVLLSVPYRKDFHPLLCTPLYSHMADS